MFDFSFTHVGLFKSSSRYVFVISSEHTCKGGNYQFTTILLKALFDQLWLRYQCLWSLKSVYFQLWFLYKNDNCTFILQESM